MCIDCFCFSGWLMRQLSIYLTHTQHKSPCKLPNTTNTNQQVMPKYSITFFTLSRSLARLHLFPASNANVRSYTAMILFVRMLLANVNRIHVCNHQTSFICQTTLFVDHAKFSCQQWVCIPRRIFVHHEVFGG